MTNDKLYKISEEFIEAEKAYILAQKKYMEMSKKLKAAAMERIEDCKCKVKP